MTKIIVEKILFDLNKILNSYDNLHSYEKRECTYGKIKRELLSINNVTEELIPLMKKLSKENPSQIKGLSTLSTIFKITYLPTLKVHLLYLSQIQESDTDLLKIQARLAITYLNIDSCIDNLRIIHSYLK